VYLWFVMICFDIVWVFDDSCVVGLKRFRLC
jgi:hypothetical protein